MWLIGDDGRARLSALTMPEPLCARFVSGAKANDKTGRNRLCKRLYLSKGSNNLLKKLCCYQGLPGAGKIRRPVVA
jgi:hypothetical protein